MTVAAQAREDVLLNHMLLRLAGKAGSKNHQSINPAFWPDPDRPA